MELTIEERNKDKLADRNEKQIFQLFVFSGKAKKEIVIFLYYKPQRKIFALVENYQISMGLI